MQACFAPGSTGEAVHGSQAEDREVGGQNTEVKVRPSSFLSPSIKKALFERSRDELAARVFEKQADIELQREEWKEEVVKSKRRALEV